MTTDDVIRSRRDTMLAGEEGRRSATVNMRSCYLYGGVPHVQAGKDVQ